MPFRLFGPPRWKFLEPVRNYSRQQPSRGGRDSTGPGRVPRHTAASLAPACECASPPVRVSMEPAKPARVETRIRTQVRDWLQYGEELGLGPYYRDRRATAVAASNSELALEISTEADQTTEMASRKILKESAAALISPVHAETLFGEKRIEGDTLPLIRDFIGDCTRCKLSKGRTKI